MISEPFAAIAVLSNRPRYQRSPPTPTPTLDDIVVAWFLCPGDQRAIPGDLVMFDRLRVRDNRGIEHALVLHFARGFVGFLDQAVDRRAIRTRGRPRPRLISSWAM